MESDDNQFSACEDTQHNAIPVTRNTNTHHSDPYHYLSLKNGEHSSNDSIENINTNNTNSHNPTTTTTTTTMTTNTDENPFPKVQSLPNTNKSQNTVLTNNTNTTHSATDDDIFIDTETAKYSRQYLRIRSYIVLLGGIMIMNCVGCIWAFGNIVPYLASYWTWLEYDKNPPLDNPTAVKDRYNHFTNLTVWSYTIMMICWAVFGPLGGQFAISFGPRRSAFVGALLTGIGTACTYYTSKSFIFTSITFCAAIGASNGMSYTPPLVVVMKWFPYNRAVASTIVMLGSSASPIWVDSIETAFVNPNDIKENSDTGFVYADSIMKNFPKVFLLLGACFFCLMTTGALLLQDPPNGYGIDKKLETDDKNQDEEEEEDLSDNVLHDKIDDNNGDNHYEKNSITSGNTAEDVRTSLIGAMSNNSGATGDVSPAGLWDMNNMNIPGLPPPAPPSVGAAGAMRVGDLTPTSS